MIYNKMSDKQFKRLNKYKHSAVRIDNGARLGLFISLNASVIIFVILTFSVPTPIRYYAYFFSAVPLIIGVVYYSKAERYLFDDVGILVRTGFNKKLISYLSISAITERLGQLRDQDGRYLKTRFIDIIVSEDKKTERLTFECGTKIMLILLAKSGVDLSHLEDAFIDAYLKSVYNKTYLDFGESNETIKK